VAEASWLNWEQGLNRMPPSAFEFFLILTGQFQVGALQVDPNGQRAARLELRTDDGRHLLVPLRDANVATLSRRFTPAIRDAVVSSADRLVDIQTEDGKDSAR
jgi:hypothetical protein